MVSDRLSTATNSPNRFVTPRNSMNGFAVGSLHGANFRRTGPTAFPACAAIRLLGRFQVRPLAGYHPLQLRIVGRRDLESFQGRRGGIDAWIIDHVLAALRP